MRLLILSAAALLLSGCFDSDDKPLPVLNSAPTVDDLMLVTQTETTLNDQLSANDADGDTLSFSVDQEPQNGSLELSSSGSFSYTPDVEFTGEDSFTFSVSDGQVQAIGSVEITVEVIEVLFSELSRNAFNQPADATPLRLNGRNISNDVVDPAAYDDLLID